MKTRAYVNGQWLSGESGREFDVRNPAPGEGFMMRSLLMRKLFSGDLPELVIFDLDGTLIDSVPDLHHAIVVTQRALQLPPSSEEDVRNWVGNGAAKLVERALQASFTSDTSESEGGSVEALMQPALQRFFESYEQINGRFSMLYDGVLETLQALELAEVPMALVTNKPIQFTPELLASLDIGSFFSLVLGGDSLPQKKPHPAPLIAAAEHFGVPVDCCLMVGDSKNDLLAARAAGMPVACVSYGYNHGEDIACYEPDLLVDSLTKLL